MNSRYDVAMVSCSVVESICRIVRPIAGRCRAIGCRVNQKDCQEVKNRRGETASMYRRGMEPVRFLLTAAIVLLLITQEGFAYPQRWYDGPERLTIEMKISHPVNFIYSSKSDHISPGRNEFSQPPTDTQSSRPKQESYPENTSRETREAVNDKENKNQEAPTSLQEIEDIIQKAIENGELLNPQQLEEQQRKTTFKRNVQRDSHGTEDPHRRSRISPEADNDKENRHSSSTTDDVQTDGSKIVFPDEGSRRVGEIIAPGCKGSVYCETPSYYPEDIVNEALRKDNKYKYLASVDIGTDVVQRIDVTDDVPLCVSTEQIVYPKVGENRDKKTNFIVNQDNFTQGVRIEKCTDEDTPCRMYDNIPAGYKSICKQKYIYRQLASINLADRTIVPDMFRFPSSCCCHVKFLGNPLIRLGPKQEQTTPVAKTRKNK